MFTYTRNWSPRKEKKSWNFQFKVWIGNYYTERGNAELG